MGKYSRECRLDQITSRPAKGIPMSVVVTGATGHLGRLVLESLPQRGVPAGEIVATGRSLEKIKDFADRGVRTAVADFNDPASLTAAFAGAQKILLISSGSDL